jgi:DNA topoisomerase-2
MSKSVAQTYQKLDDIEHVRLRTGMYAGSVEPTAKEQWFYNLETGKMEKALLTTIPAFVKIFSEILDNAIDEGRRAPSVLDTIKVTFDQGTGEITVWDNGRGIPVVIHPEEKVYVAEMIFSNLRSGSNFNDDEDQQLIGTNGVGSTLTNILSTEFNVESCDGKKMLRQTFSEGMRERTTPKITTNSRNHTEIRFTPDYAFFKLEGLDDDHVRRMTKKVVDATACNPGIKFFVNGERINVKNFGDYVALYDAEHVYDDTTDWKVGISYSDSEFEQISFVNSVETFEGGTHVWYVMDQITAELREYIKKKYKEDVKPGDIRAHMRVYISGNVNRPKFSSQTKENMISLPGSYQTTWAVPEAFIRKLIKSPIINSVMDLVKAKNMAAELKELRENSKNLAKKSPKAVDKFTDAVAKSDRHLCECYFTEGDSARASIQSARGKNQHIGSYSLRGKPKNVFEEEPKNIIAPRKNKKTGEATGELPELANVMLILGLEFGVKVTSVHQLRFGKIVILSDQDLDGFHITGLLLAFFAKFWPELFELGIIYRMNTPLFIATVGKSDTYEFFTEEEYAAWAKTAPKHKADYYKGLGGFDTDVFEGFINNRQNYLTQFAPLTASDLELIEMAFGKTEQEARKEWLEDVRYFDSIDA